MRTIDEILIELRAVFEAEYQRGQKEALEKILRVAETMRPPAPRSPAKPEPADPPASRDLIEDEEDEPLGEPVDCSTLDPLTPIQFEVFSILCAAKGEWVSGPELIRRTGNGGAASGVYPLVKKGYLRERSVGKGRKAYDVICVGAPRTIGAGEHPHSLAHRPLDVPPPAKAVIQAKVTPRKPDRPNGHSSTAVLMGDPVADKNESLNAKTYLIRKGHTCALAEGGLRVDGRLLREPEVLKLVNQYLAKAELSELAAVSWE